MEKEELVNYLRDHLTIDVNMGKLYECSSEYITATVSLQIDGEEFTSAYCSVNVNND